MNNSIATAEATVEGWWAKFKSNMVYAWHYATAWVSATWALIWGFWSALSDETKAAYVSGFMQPKHVPFVLAAGYMISYFLAHGWPQPKLEAKIEAKKDAAELASGPVTIPTQTKA